ncbi:MAG: hypothetical protein PHQ05_13540 [Sterolibacterium sp.]|nr:hypothetical protein [Sterolibacterium sp.]
MKIAAASLAFSAQHSATTSHEVRETLHAWIGATRPDFEGSLAKQPAPPPSISSAAYSAQAQDQSGAQAINDAFEKANHDPILQLIRSMLEMLTGRVIDILFPSTTTTQPPPAEPIYPTPAAPQAQASASAGFGIEYTRHETYTESEQTAFQAEGTVRTADGKEIGFRLDIAMQRSFVEESNLSLNAGNRLKKDPLVINFGGTAAQLQSQRFQFDLAGNGQLDNLPLFSSNSGYLALDLNGNGKIDSGKELFGAASGNGFADLAQHDSDGNGWIDESDPVFSKLQVWTPDQNAGGTLASLQEKQVGALFLGKQATPFELRDGANQSLGAVRASGIYLAGNGTVGTLQQIDLSI